MDTDRYTIMLVTAGHEGAKSFSVKKSQKMKYTYGAQSIAYDPKLDKTVAC